MGTALSTAFSRWSDSLKKGRKDRLFEKGWMKAFEIHWQGCIGEIGVAKGLNIYPSLRVNSFSGGQPDLDPDIEVRYRSKDNWDLIVRPTDPDDRRYVLVTGEPPHLTIHGWCFGHEAKREEFQKDYGKLGSPAFFVPATALREVSTLNAGREKD